MKKISLITLLFLCTSGSDDLFDGVKFNEQGIGYKSNIPVAYYSVGKANNETSIKTLKKDFKTTTALSFSYSSKNYYIPIEEKNMPDFIFKLKEGDLIFIDIVIFDTTKCRPTGRQTNKYCSYIDKIHCK